METASLILWGHIESGPGADLELTGEVEVEISRPILIGRLHQVRHDVVLTEQDRWRYVRVTLERTNRHITIYYDGSGLLPDGTNSTPEPLVTFYPISWSMSKIWQIKMHLNIAFYKFLPQLPVASESTTVKNRLPTLNIFSPSMGTTAGESAGTILVNSSLKLLVSMALWMTGANGAAICLRESCCQLRPCKRGKRKLVKVMKGHETPFTLNWHSVHCRQHSWDLTLTGTLYTAGNIHGTSPLLALCTLQATFMGPHLYWHSVHCRQHSWDLTFTGTLYTAGNIHGTSPLLALCTLQATFMGPHHRYTNTHRHH